jgi:hypothetical protein
MAHPPLNIPGDPFAPEFHDDESNRFGIRSFDNYRGVRAVRRDDMGRRNKERNCDAEGPLRAERNAATLHRQAKSQIHTGMSGS